MPSSGKQKGSTVLLPPQAADRVAEVKSSAISIPGPDGCEMCTWLSIPRGMAIRPEASITSHASDMSCPSAAILPSVIPISQSTTPLDVTTFAPLITTSCMGVFLS